MHSRYLQKLGISADASDEEITTANGTRLNCVGSAKLRIKYKHVHVRVNCLVTTDLCEDFLISWHDLKRMGILPPDFPNISYSCLIKTVQNVTYTPGGNPGCCDDTCSQSADKKAITAHTLLQKEKSGRQSPDPLRQLSYERQLNALLERYSDVFSEKEVSAMQGTPMKIHLRRNDPDYRPLKVNTARQVPVHFKKEADADLKWFLKSHVLEPVPSSEATEWCSPGFYVPKPNGKVRLVVDYKQLNRFIDRPTHPFPSPRDIVRMIPPEARWFIKFDALQGYYQMPLDDQSKKLTTFILPSGRYRFTRAPMGLCSSSDEFCYRTDLIFSHIKKMAKIVDDGLLYDSSQQALIDNFRNVLEACRKNNLTLSENKVVMGQRVLFAGHIISDKGIQPNPEKLKALTDFPRPTDLTSLRSFIGLANQLAAFVPDFAHMTTELRQLLRKDVAYLWLAEHQKAFEEIKQFLTTSPLIIQPFDPKLKTQLLTDASRLKGLGFALIQREKDDRLRLIQCGSRSLISAETRYSTTELECLAIQWAILDCKYYLQGCSQFHVLTDHRPLVGIFDKCLSDISNVRLLRYREKLADYNFTVTYTPGKTHYIADALSRSPVFDPPEVGNCETHCNTISNKTTTDPLFEELLEHARQDQQYIEIVNAVRSGQAVKTLPPLHPAKRYADRWDDISLESESLLVLDGCRVIVPSSMRMEILSRMHESHVGIVRMKKFAQQHFYWPRITQDIFDFVSKCDKCQTHRQSKTKEPLQHFPPALRPMHSVSIDFLEVKGKDYLVMVDRYSGFPFIEQSPRQATKNVTKILSGWFNFTGNPALIISDNGPCFREQFREWCQDRHIILDNSSPYNHESNGLAEAAVKNMEYLLLKCNNKSEFEQKLQHWRNMPSSEREGSPAERFFGWKQRINVPVLPQLGSLIPEQKPELNPFKRGDIVRIQNCRTKKWDQFGKIVAVRNTGRSYTIRLEDGRELQRNRRFLKPAKHKCDWDDQ